MLDLPQVAALIVLALLLAWPVLSAWRFALLFPPRQEPASEDEPLPPAAVVLSLRGADPSLPECIRGLLNQDYPNYAVWIIIDSQQDPAWPVVQEILDTLPSSSVPVHVRALETPRETCSLKMSAITQAVAEMGDSCAVLALIDADVIPPPDWLRCLARPLLDPAIGASTGIRWYAPEGTNWGTLVRYLWNAAACTQMHAFRIPWGGSLAFRSDVLRAAALPEQWSHSFCEDTGSHRVLRQHGLRLCLVPAATMVNRETIDLRSCLGFFRRQMVCVRLHHESWPLIVLAGWGSGIAGIGAALSLPLALLLGDWGWAVGVAGVLGLYGLGLVSALVRIERGIRRMGRPGARAVPTFLSSWRSLVALPLAQILHLTCLATAAGLRRIDWRGISYELGARGKVRLIEYRPYRPAGQAADAKTSVL